MTKGNESQTQLSQNKEVPNKKGHRRVKSDPSAQKDNPKPLESRTGDGSGSSNVKNKIEGFGNSSGKTRFSLFR